MTTYIWSASAPGDAANSANWTPTGVPATGDDAVFGSTSIVNCNWNVGVVGTITILVTYTGQIDMSNNAEIETNLTFGRNNCITSTNNNTIIKFTGTPSVGGFYISYETGVTDAFFNATVKDNILFKFEGGVSQLIVGGCYPHLQFDNGFRAQYNGTGSNYNVEWESMILSGGTVNQTSSTPTANDRLMNWITKNNTPHNTMSGASFQITSTANTLFNGGYGTWTFQPTSRLPVNGHPDYNGWTFKFENWILDSVAGNGVFQLPASCILQLTNLTINQGVSLMGNGDKGSIIHLVNRPTIHGTWGFFAIADGIYMYKNKYNLGVSFGGTGLSVVPEHRILFGKDNQKLNTSSKFTYNNSTETLSIGGGGIEFNDGTIQTTAATGGSGGGIGVNVQDEGVAITTTATTLNFVDGQHPVSTVPTPQPLCVEATGSGLAVKTITIDGSKVRTNATDTLPAYLDAKLQAGANIGITLDTSLAASVGHKFIFTADNDNVGISSADTTPNFLENKLIAGSNITLTKQNAGANETIEISSTGGGGGGGGEVVEYVVDNTTININTTIAVLYSNTPCTATSATYGTWGYNVFPGVTYDYTSYTGLVDLPKPTIGKKLSLILRPMATGVNTLGKRPTVVGWGGLQFTCTGNDAPFSFIGHDLMLQSGIGVSRMGETFVLCEPELRRWAAANLGLKALSGNPDIGQVVIDLVGVPAPPNGFSHTWQPTGNGYWDNDAPEPDPTDDNSQVSYNQQNISSAQPAMWQIATNNEMIFDATKNSANDLGFMGSAQFMGKGIVIGQLYQVLNTGEFGGGIPDEGERRP